MKKNDSHLYLMLIGAFTLSFLVSACLPADNKPNEGSPPASDTPVFEFDEIQTNDKSEGDQTKFTIGVNVDSSVDVERTVRFNFSGATATPGNDFNVDAANVDPSGGYFVAFAPGSLSATIGIVIQEDLLDESDEEKIILNLLDSSSASIGGRGQHSVAILDNDAPPNVVISSAPFTAQEGGGSHAIDFELDAVSGRNVSLTLSPSPSGSNGAVATDYRLTSTTLTIPAGQTTAGVALSNTEDSLDEADEKLTLSIGSATNATKGANSSLLITLADNDASPNVSFSTATSNANEGENTSLTVQLSHGSERNPSVKISASTNATGYLSFNEDVVFGAGETSKTITISNTENTLDEADRTATLTLSDLTNLSSGTQNSHTLTIVDDDDPPTASFASAATTVIEPGTGSSTVKVKIALSTASGKNVSIPFTLSGTAVRNTDYALVDSSPISIPASQTEVNLEFSITDTTSANNSDLTIGFTLGSGNTFAAGSISAHTVTVNEFINGLPIVSLGAQTLSAIAENASSTLLEYTATLSETSTQTINVPFSLNGGTATVGEDFTSTASQFTFTPGEVSKTVSVNIVNDSLDEDLESVEFRLTPTTTTRIFNLDASADTARINIVDDDPEPTISFSQATSSGREGASGESNAVNVSMGLNPVSGRDVTVNYTVSGTAVSGTDFSQAAGLNAVIPAGSTSANLSLNVLGNTLNNPNKTIVLTLSSPANATLGTINAHTHTIQDDDVEVNLSWVKNREKRVNSTGGFYRIYQGTGSNFTPTQSTPFIEVAYDSASGTTPNTAKFPVQKGAAATTHYFKIQAFMTINGTTYSSDLSESIPAIVPAQ